MKKILFSHSYFYKFDPKQWRISEPYPPLMTITAASLMRENGYDVRLFDVGLKDSAKELQNILLSFDPDYFVVFDDGFNWLTKMCLTNMREAAYEMQHMAKNHGATVITCSSDSTDHFDKYLNNDADYVIRGEGELTLKELLTKLDQGQNIEDLAGVSFFKNSSITSNPNRMVNRELDLLPQAAWDLVDIESYRSIWKGAGKEFHLNVATTRGCPYKCNWCAKPIYGNRYNTRSPKLVVDEIEYHVRNNSTYKFWMCDDIFSLKPGWAQEFRSEVRKRDLSIGFKIQSRADLLLQEDNIDVLVDAGLEEAWIGAESGSQEILDAMDKGTTIEQIRKSSELLKKKGVRVALFIQFGYPGETMEDIYKTIDLVLDIMPDQIGASVSYPLPGTKFYENVKADLEKKANWTDSNDLDMMFRNTYSPAFYKKLHRYLHNRHRVKRGVISTLDLIKRPWTVNTRKIKNILALSLHIPLSVINAFLLNRFEVQKQ